MTLNTISRSPTQLRAIETVYNGYRFRSRQEARWAVLMDALGVDYQYELEGFYLGEGTRYLPDFWLPGQGVWLEVKGAGPTEDEVEKATKLAQQGNHPVIVSWCSFAYDSFIDHNLTFFKDDQGVFYNSPGVAGLFLGLRFWDANSLERALLMAKQARFEFGENGR